MKSINMDYPLALRAARRAAFIDQIQHYKRAGITEEPYSEDQEIIKLFQTLKSVEAEYPPSLMAARRAAFQRQLALGGRISVLDALRASVRGLFAYKLKMPPIPTMSMLRTSLVVAILMLATFIGSLLGSPIQSASPSSSPDGFSQLGPGSVATSTGGVTRVTCKPGYLPPLCVAKPADESQDLTFQGNGSARPAVAKDALPGAGGVHKAAYVNDGLYGSSASWISNSAYSWIKIDLGKPTAINTVAFGRDRLGNSNDHDPGQFVIAVALSDNVYADGNSSNDYIEYTDVYNSRQSGFNGVVSGPETILAQFKPVTARYIKITFANPRTAVDEVEAFMIQPVVVNEATKKANENPPGISPASIPTARPVVPTRTSVPTNTAVPVPADTNTPVPADTATPVPADTNTPVPAPTDTAVPIPTNPPPTDTPIPAPPDTAVPVPTDTSPPSVNSAQPTDTPMPPSASLIQPTSIPPTNAPPADNPTATPIPVAP
ncbi:MAG TPA: hypothetical protein VLE49_08715 [Anaerolineales bacterium]|nr:hypothetical protein [Anaerolineales bacterium]